MPDREIIPGGTVEEKDRRDLDKVRAYLHEHIRIRTGLPITPIIKDADLIQPVSAIDGKEIASESVIESHIALEKVTPIHTHIRYVRDELMVAQGLDDRKAYQEIKKKAA